MSTSNVLEIDPSVPPPAPARDFVPRQVGNLKVVKVYAASPMFWAERRNDAGGYFVQVGTLFGACCREQVVTTRAAAEFVKHTNHLGVLLRLIESLGWEDLALELKSQIQQDADGVD